MADELQDTHAAALFFDLCCDSLPEAIDLLQLYGRGLSEAPGFVRYALRVLGELDVERLRVLYDEAEVSLAPAAQPDSYQISCKGPLRDAQDMQLLRQAEGAVNRLARVFGVFGRANLSEEACSTWDMQAFQQVTRDVAEVLKGAGAANGWSRPATVQCMPGGEWDLRTRIVRAIRGLRPVLRLDCDFSCHAAAGLVAMSFTAQGASAMPHTYYDEEGAQWCTVDAHERGQLAREYAYRSALVMAAAAFAGGLGVDACSVEALSVVDGSPLFTLAFERRHFMAAYVPMARTLTRQSPFGLSATRALAFAKGERVLPGKREDARYVALANDRRALPDELAVFLRAKTVAELDVASPQDDAALRRFDELQPKVLMDPLAMVGELEALIDELETGQALKELSFDGPVQVQYCEHEMGRLILPLLEDDSAVRILRAPDALYYAQRELTKLHLNTGDYGRALQEAQRLLDLASSSPEAHFLLINALVKLGRFADVVEVCKHGLRVAYGRRATAYYLYRLAYAYWLLGEPEVALACYTLVPAGEKKVSAAARRERAKLLARMGRAEAPSQREARSAIDTAGVPIPLTDEAFAQIADAAVMLCDHGFFCLAQACVAYLQSVTHDAALGDLARSLG